MPSPQEGTLKVKIDYMPSISSAAFVVCSFSFSDKRQYFQKINNTGHIKVIKLEEHISLT